MSDIDPTKMALQIAGVRASESVFPESDRLFFDPFAERFFPEPVRSQFKQLEIVKQEIAKYESMMPGVNGAIVARVRFIDEVVKQAVQSGLNQLVLIGAGYDTRAYRFKEVLKEVRIFEVDHPATQKIKKETVQREFTDVEVTNVVHVPLVFGQQRLDEALQSNGYDFGQKTLFVIEGLIMYIPPASVDGLLQFIRQGSASGSAVVFDYFERDVVEGHSDLPEARALFQFVRNEGAPLQFGVDHDDIEAFLKARGLEVVQSTTPQACKELYFRGNSRARSVSSMFHFVHAATTG